MLQRVIAALLLFQIRDRYLLEHDVNEKAMTHKVAEYLQTSFSDYNVDCEYNRNMELAKQLNLTNEDSAITYPDIIVHKRGSNDNNLLIIEAKKSNSNQDISHDKKKVEAFATDPYYYQYVILLTFQVNPGQNESCFSIELNQNDEWNEVDISSIENECDEYMALARWHIN